MQKIIYLFLLLVTNSTICQIKIDYGNNKSAGKYFTVRGINIYTENMEMGSLYYSYTEMVETFHQWQRSSPSFLRSTK